MIGEYYDKHGKPLTMLEWAKLREDWEYKRVAQTVLPDGKWVSTVWLGLNHSFGSGPPLIFESMVFESFDPLGSDLGCERYATLAEAEAGHDAMVAKWAGKPVHPKNLP